jgi:RimJ/RimL family protein N-acetyltransferase
LNETQLFVPLRSARLTLERIGPHHADAMFDILNDASLYRYMRSEVPESRATLRARYAELELAASPDGSEAWLNWIVIDAKGRALGYVQATVTSDRTEATLGWTIGTRFRGSGYGREAVATMCEHLLAAGVQRLRAVIDVRNEASIHLAEALGFARTATVVSDDVLDGVRGNDYIFVRGSQTQPPAPG